MKPRKEKFVVQERASPGGSWIQGVRVPRSRYVRVDDHLYSVPDYLRYKSVDIHCQEDRLEFFHDGVSVAAHVRNLIAGTKTTDESHRAKCRAPYATVSERFLLLEAGRIGPHTLQLIKAILLRSKQQPNAIRQCLGILKGLLIKHGHYDLERACRYALKSGRPSYRAVKLVLQTDDLPKQLFLFE